MIKWPNKTYIIYKKKSFCILCIRLIICAAIIFLFAKLFLEFRAYSNGEQSYEGILISEWLINYEGGFVRRGLIGEALYIASQLFPFPIIEAILFISILGLLSLIVLIFKTCRDEGLSIFPIIFPPFFCISLFGTRRDYWILILVYILYKVYHQAISKKTASSFLLIHTLSILILLSHEAAFFFAIPIIGIYSFYKLQKFKILRRFYIIFIILFPACLSMLAVYFFKGDLNVANKIWQSWDNTFISFPISNGTPPIGQGVAWLANDTSYAIKLHTYRFWLSPFLFNIPSLPFNLYSIFAVYYLTTRINTINLRIFNCTVFDNIQLSNILLLQLFFLIPLFGFLSCDFSRIIMYWSISSLFAFHFMKDHKGIPPFITKISIFLQNYLERSKWLNKECVYILVLLTIPVSDTQGSNIIACFGIIPYGWRLAFWGKILSTLPLVP